MRYERQRQIVLGRVVPNGRIAAVSSPEIHALPSKVAMTRSCRRASAYSLPRRVPDEACLRTQR